MKKSSIILISVFILLLAIVAGCAPGQKEVKEESKKQAEKQEKKALELTDVGFVPYTNNPYSATQTYLVIAKIKDNSTSYACIKADYSITLYNAGNAVIGNSRGSLAKVYPGQARWIVSEEVNTSPETPARAELKLTNEGWSKVLSASIPKLEVIQKNVLASQYETKITGIVRYSGTGSIMIALTGVLFDSGGNIVGAGRTVLQNMPPGDQPFSIDTYIGGAANADVTPFVTTAQ